MDYIENYTKEGNELSSKIIKNRDIHSLSELRDILNELEYTDDGLNIRMYIGDELVYLKILRNSYDDGLKVTFEDQVILEDEYDDSVLLEAVNKFFQEKLSLSVNYEPFNTQAYDWLKRTHT